MKKLKSANSVIFVIQIISALLLIVVVLGFYFGRLGKPLELVQVLFLLFVVLVMIIVWREMNSK